MALGRRIRQYFRGGDLSGSAPSPTVTQARGLRETAGPTTLTMAAVTDGQFLKRDGSTITSGVPSGTGAPSDATYIVQTASGGLSAEQAMGALATGLVKNTTTTGVQSIATATDVSAPVFAEDAGASDTYTATLSPVPAAYVTGTHYRFKANTANTGACTIDFNGLGAKTIKKVAGGITTDLADNDIRAGQWVDLVYDGTNMQMQSLLGNVPSSGLTTEEVQDIVGAEIVAGTGISVNYDDGAGTVTVTSTVSGGEDDRLMRMAQVLPRARDASVNFPGLAATPSTNGTQAQNNGSTGAFHKRTSAATNGQVASWSQNSLDTLHREFLTDITFKVRTDASLASCRIWVNIGSATMHGSSAGLGHLSAFRYATDTDGTAFWRCVTRDNATDTTTTTTLAIATDTTYILRIVESASDVKFYNHDGSTWQLLATHTTNLPSSTEDRWFNVSITTLENVAKAISLGYIHIRHK